MAKGHSRCEEHGHWPFLLVVPSELTTFNQFHNENFGWPKVILIVKNEAIGHFSFWHSLIMVGIYPNEYSHTCSSSHFSKFSPWVWVNINPQCKIFTKTFKPCGNLFVDSWDQAVCDPIIGSLMVNIWLPLGQKCKKNPCGSLTLVDFSKLWPVSRQSTLNRAATQK